MSGWVRAARAIKVGLAGAGLDFAGDGFFGAGFAATDLVGMVSDVFDLGDMGLVALRAKRCTDST